MDSAEEAFNCQHYSKRLYQSRLNNFLCRFMNQNEENQEREPIEKICQSCGFEGEIEHMVDCPKYSDDLGRKGIVPGWIHDGCCEDEFVANPKECVESCDNENLFQNIKDHFEKCVNVEGLVKTEMRGGVPVFMSQDRVFGITSQMGKFLESLKPLNIVTDVFLDKENSMVYVKDNQKNVNVYPLPLYEEIESRFSSFWPFIREEFCIKDGPLFLVYRFGTLSIGAMIAPRITETDIDNVGVNVAAKYKNRYLEAEEFFGVVLQPHREDLKSMIQKLSEVELITAVLCPLLNSLGFKGVKPISFHGPGESGGDFHPFYKTNEFGKIVYYSAQAKAVKIHSKAGVREGNVNQLIDQIKKLFRTPFISFIDNTKKRISLAFVFCSQRITPEARDQLFNEIENRQTISFVDIDDIVSSVLEQRISEQILEYCRGKERSIKKSTA